MSGYRDSVKGGIKETRWTFFKILPLALIVIVIITAIGWGLRSAGLIGNTVVERVVFEQSYQRSESIKARIAVDEAVITEIQGKLRNPNLDANTRYNLEAQMSAARVRISTAEGIK